jgi:hypothetical protein
MERSRERGGFAFMQMMPAKSSSSVVVLGGGSAVSRAAARTLSAHSFTR